MLLIAATMNASALFAQAFEGTGQQATELFAMDAGLAVFDIEHHGEGAFHVRLLDEQGRLVEALAQGTGTFGGSKAVRVPQAGRYLLDVSASGHWTVSRRQADAAPVATRHGAAAGATVAMPDTASPAYKAASTAAREVPTSGWLARGFVGGALAGPIGAAVAVGMAGKSGVRAAAASGDSDHGPEFDVAFAARVRELRKKKAFIGGMLGSGVFITALIYMVDVAQGGNGGAPGSETPPGSGFSIARLPR